MKIHQKVLLVTILSSSFLCTHALRASEDPWGESYNSETEQRFIPVELFTGAEWTGEHTLNFNAVNTNACYTIVGRGSQCHEVEVTGPYKTQTNTTAIEWAGENIPYYVRTFSIRGEPVESHFTINRSQDGLVRILDKRTQWGTRTFDGRGSKFPLGYWKQGEVRTYGSKRPTRIEILELNGPDHCITFRWIVGGGKKAESRQQLYVLPEPRFHCL